MEYLVCNEITKQYEKGKFALNKINLNIPAKGIFALIGRNGAGKTTLVRILSTQLTATSGSVSILGIDALKQEEELRNVIACVPQEARAVGWLTPRQFIFAYLLWRGLGYSEAKKRTEESARKLGIYNYLDTTSRLLSGGTRRKVLIASVVASGAKVLFLDEPTTGLDPISRGELWMTLARLKKDHFIFLTTHYLEEAERLADKIGILDDGKLRALGTLPELRKTVKYPYIIRILSNEKIAKPKNSTIVKGIDGHYQIATTESQAYQLSKSLIRRRIVFSMNPLSLDDIFYFVVKKPIEEESYEEEWW